MCTTLRNYVHSRSNERRKPFSRRTWKHVRSTNRSKERVTIYFFFPTTVEPGSMGAALTTQKKIYGNSQNTIYSKIFGLGCSKAGQRYLPNKSLSSESVFTKLTTLSAGFQWIALSSLRTTRACTSISFQIKIIFHVFAVFPHCLFASVATSKQVLNYELSTQQERPVTMTIE